MLEQVSQIDHVIFELIYYNWSNDFLDKVMPILRDKLTWIPLYIFIIGFAFWRFSLKSASLFILALVLTVGLTDFLSSHMIKKTVDRERPCHRSEYKQVVRDLVPCGAGFSFPSSHAANHFALSFFLIFSLGLRYRWINIPLVLWASLISIAQVYVGLHYPIDIMGGALLGIFVSLLMWRLYKNVILKHNPLY